MKKLSFSAQIKICIGIQVFCFILATITKYGVFSNVAFVIFGLFFTINPVWPKMWDYADHDKLRLGSRIGGILIVILGVLTRFGV